MRTYNSSIILQFTFCVSLLALFSVVDGQYGDDDDDDELRIRSCTFINGSSESVEVNCIKYYEQGDGDYFEGDTSDCFYQLFVRSSPERRRSKVKTLKVVDCGKHLHTLPELFENVRVLDISFHRNGNLSSKVLNYPHLEKLNASHSYEGLDGIDTTNIPNVIEIDLSHNELSEISDSVTKLQHLKWLDLSFNYMKKVPPFKNMTLNVEHNKISEFDEKLFALIRDNVAVRLSWDRIKGVYNVPFESSCVLSLPVVDGENVSFRVTGTNKTISFSRRQFQKIKYFSIRKNHLENIWELLDALGSTVERLELTSNYVGKINSTTFQRFKRLEDLGLDDTNLTIVGPDAFKHLRSLNHLDLSNNNLKHVNLSLFSTLPDSLTLRNIQVENIIEIIKLLPSSVFALDVSSNYIGKLNADHFDRFPNLVILFLRNTSLFQIETKAFQLFHRMVVLDFSHNYLKELNFSASAGKYSANVLYVQGNELDLNLDSITRERFPILRYVSTDRFSCQSFDSFSKRMKGVNITISNNEKCYDLKDNILSPKKIK